MGDLQNVFWGIRWIIFYPRLWRWYGEEELMKYNIRLRRNMLKPKDKLAQNICDMGPIMPIRFSIEVEGSMDKEKN